MVKNPPSGSDQCCELVDHLQPASGGSLDTGSLFVSDVDTSFNVAGMPMEFSFIFKVLSFVSRHNPSSGLGRKLYGSSSSPET